MQQRLTSAKPADDDKYLVYGGEGQHALADASTTPDGIGAPVVYVLEVQSLVWQCHSTYPDSLGQHPGLRALHISAVRLGQAPVRSMSSALFLPLLRQCMPAHMDSHGLA